MIQGQGSGGLLESVFYRMIQYSATTYLAA